MERAIHIGGSPGQIAYEAWSYEFQDMPYDVWDELSPSTQEAWEEIAEACRTQVIVLPEDGFEISFRTRNGMTSFAWTGAASAGMKDEMISRLFSAMIGEKT